MEEETTKLKGLGMVSEHDYFNDDEFGGDPMFDQDAEKYRYLQDDDVQMCDRCGDIVIDPVEFNGDAPYCSVKCRLTAEDAWIMDIYDEGI